MRVRIMAVLVLLAALFTVVPAAAQAPELELYAVSHLFALPTATTTRLFGMGGFVSCIPDDGFGNPAFAGTLQSNHATSRYSSTRFGSGLKLCTEQYSVAAPLVADRKGVQITGLRMDSTAGSPVGMPGAPVIGFQEWDLAIHYGQRLSDRWSAGVSVSPVFHTATDFALPTPVGSVAHLRSTGAQGYRLGVVYRVDDRTRAGAVYDKYHETVTASGPAFGSAAFEVGFSSETMILGVSYRLSDRLLGALEWQQVSARGAGTRTGDSGFRCGLEAVVSDTCAVRLGTNDGAWSLGGGYEKGRWAVDYAWIDDWNDDFIGAIFGGSDTHQLELTYRW
jgi:hypothetical protein